MINSCLVQYVYRCLLVIDRQVSLIFLHFFLTWVVCVRLVLLCLLCALQYFVSVVMLLPLFGCLLLQFVFEIVY